MKKKLEKLVYNRITKFLNDNDLIYPLQFGFRHNFSNNYVLINLTKDTQKNLDKGKIECGIFVDLKKAFDTADHNILLAKLEHYGICDVANDWFKSYFLIEDNLSLSTNSILTMLCLNMEFSKALFVDQSFY